MNKITTGYYQPTFDARYDSHQRQWFVNNKPTSSICLADYPCYTLGNDYSELGSHCVVIGDDLCSHIAECQSSSGIAFEDALNNPQGKKSDKESIDILSRLFFIYADNSFYFATYLNDTVKILPFDINAYQLTAYAKEIQVYIDLKDPARVYSTNIVILTMTQDTRFLRSLLDKSIISATTLLKTGSLTSRTPDVQDGFEDIDQSEALLAKGTTAVAITENQTDINSIKNLVRAALNNLPDKGDVRQNPAPLNVDIIPPIGSKTPDTDADNPPILKCKGLSPMGTFITAYTCEVLPHTLNSLEAYNVTEVIQLVSLVAASQIVTEKISPDTVDDLFVALFHQSRFRTGGSLMDKDFIFPDAIRFYTKHSYMLKNLNADDIENIISCDFTDSAFKVLAKELGSTYTLPSVKNFLRRINVYRSGSSTLPTCIPFGLGKYELNTIKMAFAQAGLMPDMKLPTYMKYKALDIVMNGPFIMEYLGQSQGFLGSMSASRWLAISTAGVEEKLAIYNAPEEVIKSIIAKEGVPYSKNFDFRYAPLNKIDANIDWQSYKINLRDLVLSFGIDKVISSTPYKYSLWSGDEYLTSDTYDWLLMLSGLSGIIPSLQHSYREVEILKGVQPNPPDDDFLKAMYGLLAVISLWQRLTLGTLESNPDSACQFAFGAYFGSNEYQTEYPGLVTSHDQIDGLAYGWVEAQNETGSCDNVMYWNAYAKGAVQENVGEHFHINNHITDNLASKRSALSLEHYTYSEIPQSAYKSFFVRRSDVASYLDHSSSKWHSGERGSLYNDLVPLAKELVSKLSIYPDCLLTPAYVQAGTRIATFDDLMNSYTEDFDARGLAGMKSNDVKVFEKLLSEPDNSSVWKFSVDGTEDIIRLLLGEFGKVTTLSYSSKYTPNKGNTVILRMIQGIYNAAMYINEHINAAIVLSDNSKETAFYKQYSKALRLFTQTVSDMLKKVKNRQQMGVVLQTLVGYLQTNLEDYTYASFISLIEKAGSIQDALVQHTDAIAQAYPDLVSVVASHKGIIQNLSSIAIAENEEDLATMLGTRSGCIVPINDTVDRVKQNLEDAINKVHNNLGIKALQPRFSTMQAISDIVAESQSEPDIDVLSQAIDTAQNNAGDFPEEEDNEPLDDISVLDDLLGTSVSQNIAQDIPTDAEPDDFSGQGFDFGDDLDDLDDYDFSQQGTLEQADEQEANTVNPLDAAIEEQASIDNAASPLDIAIAAQAVETAAPTQGDNNDVDVTEDQDGITLNLDDPAFGAQVEQDTDTSDVQTPTSTVQAPTLNSAAFTQASPQIIPPITKPTLVINAPTTQATPPQATDVKPLVINTPTTEEPRVEEVKPLVINAPTQSTDDKPLIITPPVKQEGAISTQQAKFNKPIKSGAPLVINAPNVEDVKPADTDQILYSGTTKAPVIEEALKRDKQLARVGLVITPERAGYAKTECIEPTVPALLAYCDNNNAVCYLTKDNEIYLIKGNAKLLIALLHKKNSDKVLNAIARGRFSLERYPLIQMILGHLL